MNKSFLIALFAVVALVLWMLSGQFGSDSDIDSASVTRATTQDADERTNEGAGDRSGEIVAMKVQTRLQSAQEVTREVIIQGQVEPIKVVTIKSETTGSIRSILVDKGQRVEKDEVIATMSADNREAMLTVARASLIQATNEYEGAEKLAKQGLQSTYNLESAAAKMESARAQVSAAELELDNITIRAPLGGIVNELPAATGDFIDRGNHIATLVDNSQLLITGQVPQQSIADVTMGTEAIAELITGETLTGVVHYVSSMADSTTRSFRVEVLVASPPAQARTGISAEIRIPAEKLQAHLISPAILALDTNGALGVKSVNDDDKVVFHAIEVVKTESAGAWVTGIPDNLKVITLGQGFVNAGETVQAIPEADPDSVEESKADSDPEDLLETSNRDS